VIEKGRTLRERHTLSTRTPLPEVTLVSGEEGALRALRSLSEYVAEELNVRKVSARIAYHSIYLHIYIYIYIYMYMYIYIYI